MFEGQPGTSAILTQDIKDTWYYGGYYRADFSDKEGNDLSVLALNSLYWNIDQDRTKIADEGTDQLKWLEEQLANAEDSRKFVLTYHIFPGFRFNDEAKKLWHNKSLDPYVEIIKKY